MTSIGISKKVLNLDFPTEVIEEGNGKFLVPRLEAYAISPADYAPSKAPVFYNPVMELNRDLAVLALRAYQRIVGQEMTMCEPLAGCGIRGVRVALEVSNVREVVMGDISKKACQVAAHNAHLNGVEDKTVVRNDDANLLLSRHGAPRKRFDAVDLDPFGSPVSYIDSAVRALRNNGLLAMTATDMAPLCGVHPKACFRKYGGKPLRSEYCHELAVRLLAGCLATLSAKHEIGIDVVFSHIANHYIRVYATIEYGAKKADESLSNMGHVLHCFKCFHRESLRGTPVVGNSGRCSECGSKLSVGGPLWLGKLSDMSFCSTIAEEAKQRKLKHGKRIERILALARDEADTLGIGYYVIDRLCDALNSPVPSVKKVAELLEEENLQASLTRFSPKGIKTNAPAERMKELIRKAVQEDS